MSGAIKINGTSSGSTTITAPASGGDRTLTAPDMDGALVAGSGISAIVALTQAEYDALTPSATTLYVITD